MEHAIEHSSDAVVKIRAAQAGVWVPERKNNHKAGEHQDSWQRQVWRIQSPKRRTSSPTRIGRCWRQRFAWDAGHCSPGIEPILVLYTAGR